VSNKPWVDVKKPRLEMQRHPRTDNTSAWAGLLMAVFIIAFVALLAATASPSCYEASWNESSSGNWRGLSLSPTS
jgi:hypothetical protein